MARQSEQPTGDEDQRERGELRGRGKQRHLETLLLRGLNDPVALRLP
jgi:hypothetical protein